MAWRVGMRCRCVNASNITPPDGVPDARDVLLVEGRKYTIRAIRPSGFLLLNEVQNPHRICPEGMEYGWKPGRFRPLTDITIFEEIRDGKRRVADEPVDAETLREMERSLADAGYMPPDRYVERSGK